MCQLYSDRLSVFVDKSIDNSKSNEMFKLCYLMCANITVIVYVCSDLLGLALIQLAVTHGM